ncbi:hypothetical protein [Escherichia coli]|uniref:hypothetical protein n=1 Tax=Escherichia coli TaxID=562 RepID=UPI002FCCC399
MRKSAEYLQLFDDAEKYSDSELKIQLKTLEKTDNHIWSSLKDIAILKTQIKIGVSIEQQEKLLDWPPESPDNQYHLNK